MHPMLSLAKSCMIFVPTLIAGVDRQVLAQIKALRRDAARRRQARKGNKGGSSQETSPPGNGEAEAAAQALSAVVDGGVTITKSPRPAPPKVQNGRESHSAAAL